VLEIESRALTKLGKCSTTELPTSSGPLFVFAKKVSIYLSVCLSIYICLSFTYFFEIGSHYVAQASLELVILLLQLLK
jgi:hypothetical protein